MNNIPQLPLTDVRRLFASMIAAENLKKSLRLKFNNLVGPL